jgi:hypothetical protein
MTKIKLAEALLRRKELQLKVDQLRSINQEGLFVVKTGRKHAHEGIDDIIAQVPKVSFKQITHAYDWHAKNLRRVDSAIQQANWNTEVELDGEVMDDYVDPYVDKE